MIEFYHPCVLRVGGVWRWLMWRKSGVLEEPRGREVVRRVRERERTKARGCGVQTAHSLFLTCLWAVCPSPLLGRWTLPGSVHLLSQE